MVRRLTGIYTVKFYQGPVCIVEDSLHLKIVISSVDTIFFFKKEIGKRKKTYRLFEEVEFHVYFAKNSMDELTIL